MQWSSWSEFFSMGGYGFYVWGSYGVAMVLLVAEVLMLRARKRRVRHLSGGSGKLETRNSNLETVL